MFRLPEALAAWGTAEFITTLKSELEALGEQRLVLAPCVNGFGTISDPITAMVLGVDDLGEAIEARIAFLYTVIEAAYPPVSG